jgi:APA family basic amino acid/polyamine antiporter
MTLKRVLDARDAGWLVAGNMIGAGIFITPGLVAGHLQGTTWPLLAWTLGGVLALCGAAVYGELGARFPQAGGDYRYLAAAFGPFWGFLTGWAAFVVTFSGAAAVMAIVSVDHVATALPKLAEAPGFVRAFAPPLLVLLLTIGNAIGARVAGRATVLLTAVPLLGLALLFGIGLLSGSADLGGLDVGTLAGNGGGRWSLPLLALGAAMVPVYFTYSGWNAAAYLAGEIRKPGVNLARALVMGTFLVTLFYLIVNLLFLVVLPRSELAGSTTAGAQAAARLLGSRGERVLAAMIAIAVLGSANVTLMAGARIYYAMALDGLAPRALGQTSAGGVPGVAIWVGGVWTAFLALTGRIESLVNWATLAILLLSSLAVTSLFVARRRDLTSARVASRTNGDRDSVENPYRCPGYPYTPAIYLIASLGVACASVVYDWRQALYGLLIVAAGGPLYVLVRRVL